MLSLIATPELFVLWLIRLVRSRLLGYVDGSVFSALMYLGCGVFLRFSSAVFHVAWHMMPITVPQAL